MPSRHSLALLALVTSLCMPLRGSGAEVEDVIIYCDLEGNQVLEYNREPLGIGKSAIAELLKRVSKLPTGTSIVWGPNYARCGACSGDEQSLNKALPTEWRELQAIVEKNGLTLSSHYPGPDLNGAARLAPRLSLTRFEIQWSNYRGPETPHDEVLYQLNGKYIGRGEQAFKQILAKLDQAQAGSTVTWTPYLHTGRWAMELFTEEELRAKNDQLRKSLPFIAQREELKALVAKRNLKWNFRETMAPRGEKPSTVMDWQSGDRYGETFVSVGKIVRHDQKPSSPAARLGWSHYETQRDANREESRKPENTAHYTLDDVDQGVGVDGFAKAMKRLERLPEGAVVHVKVCLRTQGPFTCPLIFEGQRHFERTGYEPYAGLYPWLLDVAAKQKLRIEWIPDEGKSCYDCQLNR